jgi:SNF2 family DNA or RNA helicase
MKRYFSKVRYARLDGSMNPKRRSEIAHEFNTQGSDTKNDIRILMMTTKACGLGLNLTAADNVIFLEHDWNPYVDMQAMDRAHRIGQKMPVTVYRLIAESTIEARILGLQHHKLTLANEIINDDNTKSSIDKDNIGSSTLLSNHTSLPIGNGNRNVNRGNNGNRNKNNGSNNISRSILETI